MSLMDLMSAQNAMIPSQPGLDTLSNAPQAPMMQLPQVPVAPATTVPQSPSTPGLNLIMQLNQKGDEAAYQAKKSKAVQQAMQAYQSGDTKSAFAALGAVNPEAMQKAAGMGAESHDAMAGKLQADKEYGQLPTQIADAKKHDLMSGNYKDINLEGPDGTVIKAKMNKQNGQILDLVGNEMSASALAGMKAGFAPSVTVNPNTKNHEVISKGGKTKQIGEAGAPVEVGANGQAIVLNPKQNDGLIAATKDWNNDKDNKTMIDQINSLDKAKAAIVNNAPGGQILEQMRLIRGMSPRPAVQEVMALNHGSGWQTQLENMISEAKGNGMTPQMQKNMLSMVTTFQDANLDEYNSYLHNRVQQLSNNYKVPSETVISRLAPSMPTPVQNSMSKLSEASPEDHEAVDWAHKVLLKGDRKEKDYGKALQILRLHGL